MSSLRIAGLLVGIIGLLVTFFAYRGPKWKRSSFVILSFFNICLVLVSSNPNTINFLADLLSLQELKRGRLMALMIATVIFLAFFSFYTRSRLENLRLQFDRLVRELGTDGLEKVTELEQDIKPIMAVIPALNEADNLRELLQKMPRSIKGYDFGVLIVDDGSEDETRQLVTQQGHLVVSNIINRGGGAALRLGYDVLEKGGADICVTMDADGQHRPEEIEKLVLPLLNNQCDIVIGSRILGGREKDSLFRLAGVYLFGALISSLVGRKITDPSSGFRAFRMDAVTSLDLFEDQYHTSELIVEAVKKGMCVKEVPITILCRKYGKSKKGKDWVYGLYFAKTILKTWWR